MSHLAYGKNVVAAAALAGWLWLLCRCHFSNFSAYAVSCKRLCKSRWRCSPSAVCPTSSIHPSVRPFVVAARLFRKHNKCSIYFWGYVCVIPMAKKCNDSRDAADLRGKGHKNKEVSSARGNDSKLACTDLKIYCTPSKLRASLPAQLCLENLELFLDGSTLSKNARFHCFASCISQYWTYSKCRQRYFDPLQYSDC